jgi:putative membrane protein
VTLETDLVRRRILLTGLALGLVSPAMAQSVPAIDGSRLSDDLYQGRALSTGSLALETSRIALAKSSVPGVRAFAQEEINEQLALRQAYAGASIATGSTGRVPADQVAGLSGRDATVLQLHQTGSAGTSFERLYVGTQMDGHRELRLLNQTYAANGADPTLQGIARQALPLIDRHLAILQDLTNSM